MLNLKKDYDSYLYGLILADGSLSFDSRNRGKVRIELNSKDSEILEVIKYRFFYKSSLSQRVRSTPFKENYESTIWSCYQKEFRKELLELGIPKKNKTELARVPSVHYKENSFWRGYIDGDGSIGMTSNNEPYISVIMKSDKLAKSYLSFLKKEFNIVKLINPNKRDNAYNIMVKTEDAIKLGNYIYDESTIHMKRKYNNYKKFKYWIRTKPKINSKSWSLEEDNYILNNSLEDSMKRLGRTEKSVKMRLWRLN